MPFQVNLTSLSWPRSQYFPTGSASCKRTQLMNRAHLWQPLARSSLKMRMAWKPVSRKLNRILWTCTPRHWRWKKSIKNQRLALINRQKTKELTQKLPRRTTLAKRTPPNSRILVVFKQRSCTWTHKDSKRFTIVVVRWTKLSRMRAMEPLRNSLGKIKS